MRILTMIFNLLTYLGCWRPNSCHSTNKIMIYNTFTTFMLSSVNYFALSQFMGIIINVNNISDFSEIFYLFLAIFQSACKFICILVSRTNVVALIDFLTGKPCKPMDNEETRIQIKCDRMARSITCLYLAMVESSVAYNIFVSVMTNLRNEKLVLGAWLPFNCFSTVAYYAVYAHQIFSMIVASLLHVAIDALFIGLLLHLRCQIGILEYRLKRITIHHVDLLKTCASHHDLIYQMANILNKSFRTIIFSQFSVSTFTICFSMYQMSNVPMFSVPFIQTTIYVLCMFTQIFFYCWFGNEVRLKSRELSDNIFATDWTSLGTSDKRTLLMIMKRTMVPIEFTSAKIINVTLESFVNLLKTSYSVYNILQQSK